MTQRHKGEKQEKQKQELRTAYRKGRKVGKERKEKRTALLQKGAKVAEDAKKSELL